MRRTYSPATWLIAGIILALMIVLRVAWPESDAYPRLSWSSALLTDEGFYIHNARNQVLFGHAHLDGWNNMLIMPLLHYLQVGVFSLCGVGVVQTRMISVVCSLLTLVLFYDGLRRAWGHITACWGTLFLGLDHVNLLYNRLGFMDTPGVLLMVCAWWAYTVAQPSHGDAASEINSSAARRTLFTILCGVMFGAAYTVRGLAALVWWAPCWASLAIAAPTANNQPTRYRTIIWYLCGLGSALLIYGILWWAPHRREIAYVSQYYIGHQLLPHSAAQLADNLHKSMDWERGFFPYLLKHTPVQFGLAVTSLLGGLGRLARSRRRNHERSIEPPGNADPFAVGAERFMVAWLVTLSIFCCSVNYSPSRYYVLFYPSLASIAAVTLQRQLASSRHRTPISAAVFLIWSAVNTGWLYDWMAHLTYRQIRADRWLATHLPPGSVVLGAVAPGLCMNNRLHPVNVIEHLCNDDRPVERSGNAPAYILIIDGTWREPWWAGHYPALLRSDQRLHAFPSMLRSFFWLGLYPANGRGKGAFEEIAAHHLTK